MTSECITYEINQIDYFVGREGKREGEILFLKNDEVRLQYASCLKNTYSFRSTVMRELTEDRVQKHHL